MKAMQDAPATFKPGEHPKDLLDWDSLRDVVGFDAYDEEEERYRSEPNGVSWTDEERQLRGRFPALCWVMSCRAGRWSV